MKQWYALYALLYSCAYLIEIYFDCARHCKIIRQWQLVMQESIIMTPHTSQQTHYAIMTSLLRQNDVILT